MKTVQLNKTHFIVAGHKIEVKNDRFYANSQLFDQIILEYKKESDFWLKDHYKTGEKIEVKIDLLEADYFESEKVTLRAYNLRSQLIWISSPIIEDHFEKTFKKIVAYVTAFVVIVGLGYLAF